MSNAKPEKPEHYNKLSKALHWVMALLIFGLIVAGLYMVKLPYSPQKIEIYILHKSFGLLVLWLVGLRIIWRLISRQPSAHTAHKTWEKISAKVAHLFLYAAMIGMPLSGWLMSSAGEYPVTFFSLPMPDLVGKNPNIASLMHEVHEILGFILIGVIGLHALGALKHHFIDRDTTLIRMMARPMQKIGPFIIIIILVLFAGAVLKFGFLTKMTPPKIVISEETVTDIKSPNSQWKIIKDQSQLSFQASVYGKNFIGIFEEFDGVINFDPDDLENSNVTIIIPVSSINSDDTSRDTQMQDADWFDGENYPQAEFRATEFERREGNNYIAIGSLTIKGQPMPLILPFQLDIVEGDNGGRKAFMTANIELNRLEHGLGTGQWETGDTVGLDVLLNVKLLATAP